MCTHGRTAHADHCTAALLQCRLQCVNAKYDPHDIFSLPVELGNPAANAAECARLLSTKAAAASAWSRELLKNAPVRPPN